MKEVERKLGRKLEPLFRAGVQRVGQSQVRVGSGIALKVETATLEGVCYS